MQTRMDADAPSSAVRAALETVSRMVGIARGLVQSGRLVDLTGLDEDMGFVCARALDLPAEEGRALRPILIGLRLELEELAATLLSRAPPQSG